jgi:hypothetical protein
LYALIPMVQELYFLIPAKVSQLVLPIINEIHTTNIVIEHDNSLASVVAKPLVLETQEPLELVNYVVLDDRPLGKPGNP